MNSTFPYRTILTVIALLFTVGIVILFYSTDISKKHPIKTNSLRSQNKQIHSTSTSTFSPQSEKKHPLPSPPLGAIANERTIQFDSVSHYHAFLASLSRRGLSLLGSSPKLLALRVQIHPRSQLDDIEGGEVGFNYPALIPRPPEVSPQAGATGFGGNALTWLGIYEDNSSWGKGVTVAVIDSGVNKHIALQGEVKQINLTSLSPGETQLSHGTAVASIISGDHPLAHGVAPASDILSVRVTDQTGISSTFTLAQGIIQATDAGAKVINISMGSYGNSNLLSQAVQYAQDRGAVIVASSGNEGLNTLAYPAAYDGVLAVGAVEQGGDHLDFSNRSKSLAITAPGYKVNAAWGNKLLTSFSGTSASAPFVSGAIAATLSEFPELSPKEAANLVVKESNDAGIPGKDPDFGYGTLDLGRIMNHNRPGIYDIAISGQVLMPPSSPTQLPEIWVTVQNQGTEMLINSPVSINTPSGKRKFNISSLAPGKTKTFKIPVAFPSTPNSIITISSSAQSTEQDWDTSNNSKQSNYLPFKK